MFRPFGTMIWGTHYNFLLVAIPLYLFTGEVLVRGGVTERMYVALADWLNPLTGGLLHAKIAASTIFAAISGSSVATAATIGTVAFPAFKRRNYKESWVFGNVASGATLGILIPSSINLIIFGAIPRAQEAPQGPAAAARRLQHRHGQHRHWMGDPDRGRRRRSGGGYFITGQPFRLHPVSKALTHIAAHTSKIWLTTPDAIHDAVMVDASLAV